MVTFWSERRWGRIVNISSGIVASPHSMVGSDAYATSKAALAAHTRSLAAEIEGSGRP
ncbi:SDR family NAD(P)-dependent oxidoreductase [Glaciihabitans sp. UYNi722]|uniref:SDR family NAD(P)-dependent oxidoreductase n=1 Tax=Glaciihabitans sp. UYNi722 TaxID=3156344 RepID=UPI003397AC8D